MGNDKIKFSLIGDLIDKNKKKFFALKRIQGFEIEFIQANKKDFKNWSAFINFGSKTVSLANYYWLLITEILPNNVEKAICLDCDIIVNKEIYQNCGISVLIIV
jgi:lipopolysaccharide biosynthesis glycosyltransferase